MNFSESYFEDEVRDGFLVSGILKRFWAAQLEVLEDISSVCIKYNISYYADCGTLLGAVRHKGYIPWDDDMDICMMREDYNRFLAVAKKELPSGYEVRNIHTADDYDEFITRVINGDEISFKEEHLKKYHGCPYIAGVDIFPIDCLPNNEEEQELQWELIRMIILALKLVGKDADKNAYENLLTNIEKFCNVKLNRGSKLKRQLCQLAESVFSLYNSQDAKEVAVMPLWADNKNHRFPKAYYDKAFLIPFENTKIPVPVMCDSVLQVDYGDYMQCIMDEGYHDYPVFKHQEDLTEQILGTRPYIYNLTTEEICDYGCKNKKTKKDQLRKLIEELSLCNENVKKVVLENDSKLIQEQLMRCQDTAIRLGKIIDEVYGEGRNSVYVLEEYCEVIYQIYCEIIVKLVNKEDFLLQIDRITKKALQIIKEEIELRKEVVFLPHKASMWEIMSGIWKTVKETTDTITYVIPIPYFYKDINGKVGNQIYEGSLFPKDVPITDYMCYNFEHHMPDVVYMQCPYDEYSTSMTLHPFFYTQNIKKFTKELVYVQNFLIDERMQKEARQKENLRYCCLMPGMAHVDKIILQSETMKDVYVDLLSAHFGEKTRNIWEKKINVRKLSCPNAKEKEKPIPSDWLDKILKPDKTLKKIVIYNLQGDTIQKYGQTVLNKINRVIQLFKEKQKEITLLWIQQEEQLAIQIPQYWNEYRKIVNGYIKEGWGIYDNTGNEELALQIADAYYGDGGALAYLCISKKIPTMIQNIDL